MGRRRPQTEALGAAYGGDPRIEWLGRLTEAEVASRMRGADVFCAPSLHGESFGVVLLEAMAAGAVVVASELDGYCNVATNGVDALMTPPGTRRPGTGAVAGTRRQPACVRTSRPPQSCGPRRSRWPGWPSSTSSATSAWSPDGGSVGARVRARATDAPA